jgi:Dockerin type I domain
VESVLKNQNYCYFKDVILLLYIIQEKNMRPLIIMLVSVIIIAAASSLSAQDINPPYQYSFSSAVSDTVHFNFDITDSLYMDTTAVHQLVYRDQSATSWSEIQFEELYQVCGSVTFSAPFTYQPETDILEWFLQSENDTTVVSQSPENSGNLFPVPEYLMADMGADAVGDAENTSNNFLDIIHSYASYSDTKLYFRLDNNGGGFPTNSGIFTYFIYSVGLIDPNTTDSVAYVLVYANVPALFSPGLYRLDPVDSSFTNLASIETNISGNSLNMSCNISDLTSQPGWSDWPPPSGFIGMAPVTATVVLTDMQTNDFGKTGLFIPKSTLLDYTVSNNPPILIDVSVSNFGNDSVLAEATYTDADSNPAVMRNLIFQSTTYPMKACEKDYALGALFEHRMTVTEDGWYDYYFEFSDGLSVVSTPVDSIYIDIYYCGDANSDEIVNISDAVALVNYVFVGGSPAPDPLQSGDTNCDGSVDISDAVLIVNYIFVVGGPAPCDPDGDLIPDC